MILETVLREAKKKAKKGEWPNQILKWIRNFNLLMENPTECEINSLKNSSQKDINTYRNFVYDR